MASSAFRFAVNNFDAIQFDSRQKIDSNRFVRFDLTAVLTEFIIRQYRLQSTDSHKLANFAYSLQQVMVESNSPIFRETNRPVK